VEKETECCRREKGITGALLDLCAVAAVAYFLFVILWGINYNRLPFAASAGIDVRETTVTELFETCAILINKTNSLRSQIPSGEGGIADLSGDTAAILNKTASEFDNIKSDFPALDIRYSKPKPVIMSQAMLYTGITGVYFPFTGEANVNTGIKLVELPFTACHELAHQAGFAREDEANFISWLVCSQSADIDFNYSGNLMASIYLLNSLSENDVNKWAEARGLCSSEVNMDMNALGQFWEKYEGAVHDISNSVNDAFLKVNLQEDGVKSYGRMVDLLIAYL
jgi:hypothetical protein